MSIIRTSPGLTEQVYQALLDEICSGALPAGAHLVQEQLAQRLGVSRQPVQQAMALLKADGMVEEGDGRGLRVAALDLERMRAHYEIRAVLDGLAARGAARRAATDGTVAKSIEARGRAILATGKAAVVAGDTSEQIRQDEAFHGLLYEMSGNPLLAKTADPHWRFLRRVMGEVLRHAETPEDIWAQHAAILESVVAGNPLESEMRAIGHIENAAEKLSAAVRAARGEDEMDGTS